MAKIETSAIEGFDTMDAQEQVKALLGMDIPEKIDLSQYVPKATADKYASEAAEFKKQLKGKTTQDKAQAADQAAQLSELQEQLASIQEDNQRLKLERTESLYKAKYLAMSGFDEKLAEETAKALASGDMDKVFENQQKAYAAYEKALKSQLVRDDPRPGGSGGQEDKDEALEFARALGKKRAEARQAAQGLERFAIR